MTSYDYIDNNDDLIRCCLVLQDSSVLSVDTEFVRERTFYPQPGLIQVSDGNNISLIDPNACDNLQPFFDLLETSNIKIVMHSSSEDIELFYSMGCGVIQNLFDTQIAASWLGMGQSLSLQKIVEYYEQVVIEKQHSRTNWLKRPLSDAQLEYAAIDVLYLNSICEQQQNALLELGYSDFMVEDCDLRCEQKSVEASEQLAYLKVKKALIATGESLNRLQQLAIWREQAARKNDRPRQHVIKDQQLLCIALEGHTTLEHLTRQCELPPFIIRRYGEQIIEAMNNLVTDTKPVVSLKSLPNANKTLSDCRALMVDINLEKNIPREVLPSKRWFEQFLLHHAVQWYPEPDGWKGWRKALLEEPLNKIINENKFNIK